MSEQSNEQEFDSTGLFTGMLETDPDRTERYPVHGPSNDWTPWKVWRNSFLTELCREKS